MKYLSASLLIVLTLAGCAKDNNLNSSGVSVGYDTPAIGVVQQVDLSTDGTQAPSALYLTASEQQRQEPVAYLSMEQSGGGMGRNNRGRRPILQENAPNGGRGRLIKVDDRGDLSEIDLRRAQMAVRGNGNGHGNNQAGDDFATGSTWVLLLDDANAGRGPHARTVVALRLADGFHAGSRNVTLQYKVLAYHQVL